MVVMRKKTPAIYKARLVSRGDSISEEDMAFASSPNADRVIIRTVICAARLFDLRIGNADVTQAFPQSDTVAFAGRQIICIPAHIVMTIGSKILENG